MLIQVWYLSCLHLLGTNQKVCFAGQFRWEASHGYNRCCSDFSYCTQLLESSSGLSGENTNPGSHIHSQHQTKQLSLSADIHLNIHVCCIHSCLKVYEAYGQTECTAGCTFTTPGDWTSGKPMFCMNINNVTTKKEINLIYQVFIQYTRCSTFIKRITKMNIHCTSHRVSKVICNSGFWGVVNNTIQNKFKNQGQQTGTDQAISKQPKTKTCGKATAQVSRVPSLNQNMLGQDFLMSS